MKLIAVAALLSTTALASAAVAQTNPSAQQQGQQAQQAQQGQQGQQSQVAAAQMRNQPVYSSQGEQIGTVNAIVRGRDNQTYAVMTTGQALGERRQVVVPANRIALQGNRVTVRGNEQQLRQLQAYDQNAYQPVQDSERFVVAVVAVPAGQQQAQADGAEIVVRQSQPQVQVEQAQPRVVVQQPQPNVTVRQPRPQIIVRQAPPTITVQQPQPEIIVRMPEPDVNVSMAQPQVQVNQPQPEVRVVQPEQRQAVATVNPAQPRVQVIPPQQEANVNLQRADQPQVSYERTGEPRVIFNEAQGQPTIRYEQMQGQQQAQQQQMQQRQQAQMQQRQQQAAVSAEVTPEEQQRARETLGVGDVENTAAINQENVRMQPIGVASLEDMEVRNLRGQEIGEVDRVITTPQGRQFVVVESGGFLGIGADRVAFPLERFWLRGDQLFIRGVTEQDIEAMDDYRDQIDSFQRLPRNQQAELRVWE